MSAARISDRLAALEAEVAELQKQKNTEEIPWWKDWVGAFLNDPYFEQAMTLGKKYRDSTKPKASKKRKKQHGHS